MHHTLAALYNPVLPSILGGSGATGTEGGATAIGLLLGNVVGLVLILAACLAFAFLLTGGVQWITSGGDKAALESARNKITHAIIGLIIVAAAYAVFSLVGQFLGLTKKGEIKIEIPTFQSSKDYESLEKLNTRVGSREQE